MKRRRSVAIEALGMLAFAVVALGFQATVRYRPQAHGAAWSAQQLSSSSFERTLARPAQTQRMPNGHRNGVVSRGVTMMARARYLLAEQKRRAKSAAPVILSAKDKRKANRERRAHYREKFARSGSRLVKLQQEDPDSFYIGFLGTNGAGRAAALKSVETFLKRVTELKVAKYYKGDANIKLVDAGNVRLSRMAGNGEHKLGLLRRCDLLVHVVRCFDLFEPKKQVPREASEVDDDGAVSALNEWQDYGEENEEEIDWPLSPTPLEDIKRARTDMAFADLQFIEERHKSNHTKWFWRDRRRAYNERTALQLITPVLENAYTVGGELKPVGRDFAESCLRDERSENGTMLYRSRLRTAVTEIGFLTSKPVVYVANIPPEAAPSDDLEHADDRSEEVGESAEAIAKVALAHAAKVVDINQQYDVPAAAACLMAREGQEITGAMVFKSIPRSVLNRDPKLKKAAKSVAGKALQRPRTPSDASGERAAVAT